MISRSVSFVLLICFCCRPVTGQAAAELRLARELADPVLREKAVAVIAAAGERYIPVLLGWTDRTPSGVDRFQLDVGLADAFGALRARDAIPFLVKNISLDRYAPIANSWLKAPESLERRLPAAMALVRIGPEAAKAVMVANARPLPFQDRLASIFVVSRIDGAPGARNFILAALGEANVELAVAEEALKRVGK